MKLPAAALFALLPLVAAAPSNLDTGKVIGTPAAPIELEIFSSFDCPHCKVAHDELVPQLVKDYVVAGKLFIVSREFPLTGQYHQFARLAAEYATAAARIGKYPQVADALYKNQAAWSANGKVWETVASVLTLPDQTKVQALVKTPAVTTEVQRDMDEGMHNGISSTPSMFLTAKGKRMPLPPGVPNYELLRRILSDMEK
jgi:protein-disulfide isomerase